MKTHLLVMLLVVGCGGKEMSPEDKKAACDNIYTAYSSHQDRKMWSDACNAAPNETVRCVNLVMEEGKDSACMKALNNPERNKLVYVLNGVDGKLAK